MDETKGSEPTHAKSTTPRTTTAWHTLEGRVISLVSRKGGVGKTTSAVNIGAALALSGHTVLVIGTDPQCGVCRTLGVDQKDLSTNLDDIFTKNSALTKLVQTSPLENLFFVSPRITSLMEEEMFLANMELRADDFVREVDRARNLYDTILIDCPPSLGASTRSALLASDSFLVPVQAEELCRNSLNPLMDFVADFRGRHFPDAKQNSPLLEGLFLTMVNNRTRMSRHVSAQVCEEFGSLLMDNVVPRTTRMSEMALKGKPAVIFARKSAGSRAYFNLADELMQRFQNLNNNVQPDEGTALFESPPTPVASATPSIRGLDRLLAELGRTNDIRPEQAPEPVSEPASLEMVSLDDLLAEEEQDSGYQTNRPQDDWTYGLDSDDPLN